MPKYLISWEVDPSRVPLDLKERGALWLGMVSMIRQQISDGVTTDWGAFVGENKGYSVGETSEIELAKLLNQFYPYVLFEVHQVASIDDLAEVAKSLAEG